MLSLDLAAGGHLSHGVRANLSGRWFEVRHYGVSREHQPNANIRQRDGELGLLLQRDAAGGGANSRLTAREGELELKVDDRILAEYTAVLKRRKFRAYITLQEVRNILMWHRVAPTAPLHSSTIFSELPAHPLRLISRPVPTATTP